jgi:hypothetical protein
LDGAAGPRMRLTEYEITRRTVGSRSRNRPPPLRFTQSTATKRRRNCDCFKCDRSWNLAFR